MYIHSHIFCDGLLDNFDVLNPSNIHGYSDLSYLLTYFIYLFIYLFICLSIFSFFEEVYVIIQLDKFYKSLLNVGV